MHQIRRGLQIVFSPNQISTPIHQETPHLARLIPSAIAIIGTEDEEEGQGHAGGVDEGLTSNVGLWVGKGRGQDLLFKQEHVESDEASNACAPGNGREDVDEDLRPGDRSQPVKEASGAPVLNPLRKVIDSPPLISPGLFTSGKCVAS